MKRVAVIGGGLSGLSAAYQLARTAKAEFELFEASSRLGGNVETLCQDGFVIECGPDAWVSEKPWARELAIELGLEDEIIPSNDDRRRNYLLRGSQLLPMPEGMRMMVPARLDAIMNSPLFSEEAKRAYAQEPGRAAELKAYGLEHREDESVANFVRRHLGEEATQTAAAPLLSGVFGGDIEQLSAHAVLPAFVEMEREHGSLIVALQSGATQSNEPIFTTLRSGLGTLIDRMAATLPRKSLRLSSPVIGLTRRERQWRVRTIDSESMFDDVIVATPAHIARHLLGALEPRFDQLLAMDATSAIVVALAFKEEVRVPAGFGYLIPRHGGAGPQLLACTFVDQKFPHRAPAGATLLRAFFGGESAASLRNESDDAVAALAVQNLTKALGPLPQPHITVVRKWPWSLPQYAVGHLERIEKLEALVKNFPGLHLIGNAYHGVGLPDMVRMGRRAAEQLRQT